METHVATALSDDLKELFYTQEEISAQTGWSESTLIRYGILKTFPAYIRIDGKPYWEKEAVKNYFLDKAASKQKKYDDNQMRLRIRQANRDKHHSRIIRQKQVV